MSCVVTETKKAACVCENKVTFQGADFPAVALLVRLP